MPGAWNRQEQNETLPQIVMQTFLHGYTTNKSINKRINKGTEEGIMKGRERNDSNIAL
jgi:hypothetical protein